MYFEIQEPGEGGVESSGSSFAVGWIQSYGY